MKFSDIRREQWEELRLYLDTCLLPVTGLTGSEPPYETTEQLERLRDVMDLIEIPFKGRIVTYPACHYYTTEDTARLEKLCKQLKEQGFRYVIIVTLREICDLQTEASDLIIRPSRDGRAVSPLEVKSAVQSIWQRDSAPGE